MPEWKFLRANRMHVVLGTRHQSPVCAEISHNRVRHLSLLRDSGPHNLRELLPSLLRLRTSHLYRREGTRSRSTVDLEERTWTEIAQSDPERPEKKKWSRSSEMDDGAHRMSSRSDRNGMRRSDDHQGQPAVVHTRGRKTDLLTGGHSTVAIDWSQ